MDWQARYYPLDVFATLNTRIEQLIKSNDFRAVELVKEEINAVGTPDLKTWSGSHKNLFVPLSPDVQFEARLLRQSTLICWMSKVPISRLTHM
jgi:hypothetical protein